MSLFLALLPLVLLIFVMVSPWPGRWLPLPATVALPGVALLAYGLQWGYFRAGHPLVGADGVGALGARGATIGDEIHAAVVDGVLSALTPLSIVFGAILLFKTLEHSGAMGVLTGFLRRLTPDPVAQCVLLGWSFSFLVEGLSGFGTPAALAAPVLLSLLGGRHSPVRIAALCLVMNSAPVSFGAVGTPTWFGMGGLGLSAEDIGQIGQYSALIHGVAAPVIVLLALRIVHSWSAIGARLPFVLAVVGATMVPYVVMAVFSSEFPSIVGGLCSLTAAVVLARLGWGLPRVDGLDSDGASVEGVSARGRGSVFRAAFPILGVIVLLAVTRIGSLGIKPLLNLDEPRLTMPLGRLGEFWISPALVVGLDHILSTTMNWRMPLLYVPFILPFVVVSLLSVPLLGMSRSEVGAAWRESVGRLRNPAMAMVGALVLVKLLMLGNLLSPAMILGRSLGEGTGQAWPWFAALLGALGSFFSGSNTVSNLTFAPIQLAIAETQNLPPNLILALQSVGGALGNMVCIHNIVAVAAILGLKEGRGGSSGAAEGPGESIGGVAGVLRLTFPPMVAYAAIAALMAVVLRW